MSIKRIREAAANDLPEIARIWNEGIVDRIATLDENGKDADDCAAWFADHGDRYVVIVADGDGGRAPGWASLARYSHRRAYDGVADLSIYIERRARGRGVGTALLRALERHAVRNAFHKIVLFALAHNTGRSQMAEAYLRHFAGDAVEVASAGTIAADVPDPGVVAAMAEDGIDISGARPKLIDPAVAAHADRIITMGCDVEGVPNIDADWDVDDPKGAPPETLRAIRDQVKSKARELAESLRV